MREYKFRGKRLDNKEWVYGYIWIIPGVNLHYILTGKIDVRDCSIEKYEVDPKTVGQFVENNHNGIPIYEGDIDGNDEPMYVAYEDGMFGFKFKGKPDYFDPHICWRFCEIIGNVHDHPHLLKE